MIFEVNMDRVKVVTKDINKFMLRSAKGLEGLVSEEAVRTQEAVRRYASGRPGPNVQTGEYVRGILIRRSVRRFGPIVNVKEEVYTLSPQAARLEFGFVGVDSLGRVYHQPPYPHWVPAILELESRIDEDIDKAVSDWLK